MNFSKKIQQPWAVALVCAFLVAALGWGMLRTPFGRGLTNLSFDLLTVARGNLPVNEAVIVYMDDVSYDRLEQSPDEAWDRALHAQLLDRLTEAGARAVVFDILFTRPNDVHPEDDRRLAEAMRRQGAVVLGADHVPDGPFAKRFVPPFDLLLDHAAAVGSVELDPSLDMIVRRHAPLDELIPTLSWAAALVSEAEVSPMNLDGTETRWINYYGPPNYLPWFSYYEALDPARVGNDSFKDRVVFVGDRRMTKFAGERKDEYRNPFSFWLSDEMRKELGSPFISGVEIQATVFLNYWRHDWLRRWSSTTELWIVVAFGLLSGFLLVRVRSVAALALAVAATVTVLAVFHFLHKGQHLWFPWLILILQLGVALSAEILFNSLQLYVQKRMYKYTLGLYLSPKLVKRFSRDTNLLKPGGEEQTLTILFTDIASFTDYTQQMDSATLAKLMNDYFHVAVTECIHETDGTVVKYIGDAIFAFWNAPETQSDHALRTCRAALQLQTKKFYWPGGDPLITRIGVHTGSARVGNFGSPDRVDYTALGESVNLASRLEGLNKYLKTNCLISGSTYTEIEGRLVTRRVGSFQLKGFATSVEVHELVGTLEEATATVAWRDEFARALENYEKGDFELAAMGFQATLELRPLDGPSEFFLMRLKEMDSAALPADWNGRTQLWEK